jgi:hypothetical protein
MMALQGQLRILQQQAAANVLLTYWLCCNFIVSFILKCRYLKLCQKIKIFMANQCRIQFGVCLKKRGVKGPSGLAVKGVVTTYQHDSSKPKTQIHI